MVVNRYQSMKERKKQFEVFFLSPEPIPSTYTRHAAWINAVTVSNRRSHSGSSSSSSPMVMKPSSSRSHTVFMKFTHDRMSRTLRIHRRPNSWLVSQSMKSNMRSAMSLPEMGREEWQWQWHETRTVLEWKTNNSVYSLVVYKDMWLLPTNQIQIF